jgi:hypothetical protein
MAELLAIAGLAVPLVLVPLARTQNDANHFANSKTWN